MTLQDRAATALDQTHFKPNIVNNLDVGKIRFQLASWLDGANKMKITLARRYIEALEMVSRN